MPKYSIFDHTKFQKLLNCYRLISAWFTSLLGRVWIHRTCKVVCKVDGAMLDILRVYRYNNETFQVRWNWLPFDTNIKHKNEYSSKKSMVFSQMACKTLKSITHEMTVLPF